MKSYFFRIVLTKEDDGRWSAEVPTLPGCATCGDTQEEAVDNIHDAVEAYIRDMQKAGEEIPTDATLPVLTQPVVAVTL